MSLKPMTKSLHTVTALVCVAKLHLEHNDLMQGGYLSEARAVAMAAETLGYDVFGQDTYGLAKAAVRALEAKGA